ncbi:hypothetical protein ACVIGB_000921 [Bradyrhizobium sp. USDA 4341]
MIPEKSLRIGHPNDGPSEPPRARSTTEGIRQVASKLMTDITPSVIATVLGAYIVTHYINTDKQAAKPPVAAVAPAPAPAVDPGSAPVVPVVSASPDASPIRIIPGTTTVPTVRADEAAPPEKLPERRDEDKAKVVAKPPAPKHAVVKEKLAVAPAAKTSPIVEKAPETTTLASSNDAATQAPTVAGAVAAGVTAKIEPLPAAAPSDGVRSATAIGEDALEKARQALERAKAQDDAERVAATPTESVVLPEPVSVAPREKVAPAAPGEAVRTTSTKRIEPSAVVSPLPPPVIVAQPPIRSRSAEALPEARFPDRADQDDERPVPPAPIPDRPADRGGFLLIR